jgi:hypothetical protein
LRPLPIRYSAARSPSVTERVAVLTSTTRGAAPASLSSAICRAWVVVVWWGGEQAGQANQQQPAAAAGARALLSQAAPANVGAALGPACLQVKVALWRLSLQVQQLPMLVFFEGAPLIEPRRNGRQPGRPSRAGQEERLQRGHVALQHPGTDATRHSNARNAGAFEGQRRGDLTTTLPTQPSLPAGDQGPAAHWTAAWAASQMQQAIGDGIRSRLRVHLPQSAAAPAAL